MENSRDFGNTIAVLVGPTATGKSRLALEIAKLLPIEIVNGDSRLLYRHMNIGTAKPSASEMDNTPHHLINILDPNEPYSLALYINDARRSIEQIHKAGRLPLLVGGTGQYIWGLIDGFQTPQVAPSPEIRDKLEAEAGIYGKEYVWQKLNAVDTDSASHIDFRNLRRVIRALEVYLETGVPFSKAKKKDQSPPYRSLIIGLKMENSVLYEKIEKRSDMMMELGWIEEVSCLLKNGYGIDSPAMSSIGYREIASHLSGFISREDVIKLVKTATRKFARRQYSWFRQNDTRINWIDANRDIKDVVIDAYSLIQKSIGINYTHTAYAE